MSPTSTFISTPVLVQLLGCPFAKVWLALYTQPMRRLGIDLGTVRTGLAIAEPELHVATPLCTLQHRSMREAVQAIAQLIAREGIDQVVVGLPLQLDGREGDAARRVRQFARALTTETQVALKLWDERLSSVAAQRSLQTQGVRSARQRAMVDQVAATLLLQSFLDHVAGSSRTPQADP
ncbi:MAG: Holliday junction resolvase RuvX [Polyangiales bacterium]